MVGAVIGLIGAFVQADRLLIGTVAIPWGTVLVLVVLVLVTRGGVWLLVSRWGGFAVLLGWLSLTIVMSADSPSGDLALSAGGRQMAYLVGGVIVATAATTVPAMPRRVQQGKAAESA